MKVNVIKDKCIGCGNCVSLTESVVFDFDDEGFAEAIVDVVPEDLEETAKMAIVQCPTEAIEEVKETENSNEKDKEVPELKEIEEE